MPTLNTVTTATVARLLDEQRLNAAGAAQALADYFAHAVVEDIADSILAWLRGVAELTPEHRQRILQLASRHWAGVSPVLAAALFRAAVTIAEAAAQPLLDAVEGDPAAGQAVKEAAANYRTWIDRSP
jgi:hypothetical protein